MTKNRERWLRHYRAVQRRIASLDGAIRSLGLEGTPLVWAADNKTDPDGSPMEIATNAAGALAGVAALTDNLFQRVLNRGNPNA